MQNTINVSPTLHPNRKTFSSNILSSYITYTKAQEKHQMLWYILGLVFIPCVAIILSVFAMNFLQFPHMAYYMTSTFIFYYAIVVAHVSGGKPQLYISLFLLNILYLFGAPLLVLLFN